MIYKTSEEYFKDHPEERYKIKRYKPGESGIKPETIEDILLKQHFEPFTEEDNREYIGIKSDGKNNGWVSCRK